MYLQFGTYQHSQGDAVVTITGQTLRSQSGVQYGIEETWAIRGMLQGATQAALTTAIQALRLAYSVDYKNVGLYLDDGTPTNHVRAGLTSIGGVTVEQPPHFPEGTGAEYSTYRTYQIVLKVRYPNFSGQLLLSWMETLVFSGTGGPKFVYLQPLQGLPQKHQVASASTARLTQSGNAVGLTTWPSPAACISPADEHVEQRRIVQKTPKRMGNTPVYLEYEIEWAYEMETVVPVNAQPTLWA